MARALRAVPLVVVFGALSACAQPVEPDPPTRPDSPVGHYETKLYVCVGRKPRADGSEGVLMEVTHNLTIDVRPDHTFKYEWTRLGGRGTTDGSLEGRWRDDPQDGPWAFEAAGDAGTWRPVSYVQGEMVRPGEVPDGKTLVPGQWAFPIPDTATEKLTNTYLFILCPAR